MVPSRAILQEKAKAASSCPTYAISDNEFADLMNRRDNMHTERISNANRGTRPATMYQVGEKVLLQDHILSLIHI